MAVSNNVTSFILVLYHNPLVHTAILFKLHKSGVARCWIFSFFTLTHTKVKVKKSENAVSVHAISSCKYIKLK